MLNGYLHEYHTIYEKISHKSTQARRATTTFDEAQAVKKLDEVMRIGTDPEVLRRARYEQRSIAVLCLDVAVAHADVLVDFYAGRGRR
jgi:hypothetical protein